MRAALKLKRCRLSFMDASYITGADRVLGILRVITYSITDLDGSNTATSGLSEKNKNATYFIRLLVHRVQSVYINKQLPREMTQRCRWTLSRFLHT